MKRIKHLSVIAIVLFAFTNLSAQVTENGYPDLDSLNFRAYEKLYYLPDPIVSGCIPLDACNQQGDYVSFPSGYGQIGQVELFNKTGSFLIRDIAQPYIAEDTLKIIGVSMYFKAIQYGSMFPYLGITDNNLNFIDSLPVPSYHDPNNVLWPNNLTTFCRYRELMFDSIIKVKGLFYVRFDNPKPIPGYNWDISYIDYDYIAGGMSISQIKNFNNCDSDTLSHSVEKVFFTNKAGTEIDTTKGTNDWISTTVDVVKANAVFMFPILEEPLMDTVIEGNEVVINGNEVVTIDSIIHADTLILRTTKVVCDTNVMSDTLVHLYLHNTNHKDTLLKGDSIILCDTTVTYDTTLNSGLNTALLDKFTNVFPNPANSEINITCSFKIKSIQLYDERGVLIENLDNINAYSRVIGVSRYDKGNYFVKITTKSGTATKKIIIQ